MAARPPRSSAGCWTCRLRRKKCDEARPICEGCAALEIECLYSETRPIWMDNGPRQRAMADRLKLAVKDRAAWRREKRFLRDIETGAAAITLGGGGDMTDTTRGEASGSTHLFSVNSFATPSTGRTTTDHPPASPPSAAASGSGTSATSSTSPNTPTDDSMGNSICGESYTTTGVPAAGTATSASAVPNSISWTPEATLAPPSLDQERELNLMMIYLDYVFPFLYPFCRPTVLGSGRGWLLVLLMKNKAVFHSALSLSSYFMAVVATTTYALHTAAGGAPVEQPLVYAAVDSVSSGGTNNHKAGDHSSCLAAMAAELHKQQELSLRELQRTIAAISRGHQSIRQDMQQQNISSVDHLAESARAIESILHLLSFEVVLQRFDSWQVHLDAALSLFEQTMRQYGGPAPPGKKPWSYIMEQLSPWHSAAMAGQTLPFPIPYCSDQAALRFYASLLLYMDTVTSTVTETAPRLHQYHQCLLAPEPDPTAPDAEEERAKAMGGHGLGPWSMFDPNVAVFLSAEDVVGIRNWVLLALADAAALAAWKKEMISARRLNVAELLARAAPIEKRLRGHIAALEAKLQRRAGMANGGGLEGGQPRTGFPLSAGFYSRFIAMAEVQLGEMIDSQKDEAHQRHARTNGESNIPSLPPQPQADSAATLSVDTVSHIWGLGVLTYLLVVVNGWQPAADSVRQAADRTLAELAALPSASCLRVAAWPLCVSGCLATTPQQRALYPGMVGEICGGELFGTVNEALRIMQAVWAAQDGEGGASSIEWDFGRCFNILGRRAFLL
ncbi:hypothetical protein SEUCBS140593_007174 [Sporothrix eucalyptigena]|uniref:Zn(2)-C6 fungal-type domain-containing protein n=1 Tax=Sporothrix eucalyptigena TaxID=1812306 RepID=A0ABP0CBD2_9PEZI